MTALRMMVAAATIGCSIAIPSAGPEPFARDQASAGEPAARQGGAEQAAVVGVAEAALAAITRGDMIALTDLMLPEAVIFPTSTRDGVPGYRVRTRAELRSSRPRAAVTERGFRPEARVNGPVAMVWFPYDLYLDGKWSHCGVDVFTLIRNEGQWRIAAIAWSAEQPPACEKHPDGPPRSGAPDARPVAGSSAAETSLR